MSQRKFLAFDIETAKLFESGKDWRDHRPLGITVAVTLPEDAEPRAWYGQGAPDGFPLPRMPNDQAQDLVAYLQRKVGEGYTLLAWNGLGFDLNVLAEESGLIRDCRALALDMVDPMFHFYWVHGYPVGLQAVADGMGLPGKGGAGHEAPQKWAECRYQEVTDYCIQDVQTLLQVTRAIETLGHLFRITRSGKSERWDVESRQLLKVRHVLELPSPRSPWIPQTQFTDWLQGGTL